MSLFHIWADLDRLERRLASGSGIPGGHNSFNSMGLPSHLTRPFN